MAEIDILAYEEELKKEQLKRFLKNKKVLTAAFVALMQVPTIILNEISLLKLMCALIIGIQMSSIKTEWLREPIYEERKIAEILRNSKTYKELMNLYNEYIQDVAKFIKEKNLTSAKEIVIYLQFLIDGGVFAENHNHAYKIFNNENDYLAEICGARVTTGTSVCRHTSSFFVDVLTALDYTAANISVRIIAEDPIKYMKKGKVTYNHSVVGIVENNERYTYDPTNATFSTISKNIASREKKLNCINEVVGEDTPYYIIMNPNMNTLNFNRKNECTSIKSCKTATITKEEVSFIRNKIFKLAKSTLIDQYIFHQNHETIRAKIATLYKKLEPFSDEKILKYTITK